MNRDENENYSGASFRTKSPGIHSQVEKNFSKYIREKAQRFPVVPKSPINISGIKNTSGIKRKSPRICDLAEQPSIVSIYETSSVIKKPTLNRKVDIDKWAPRPNIEQELLPQSPSRSKSPLRFYNSRSTLKTTTSQFLNMDRGTSLNSSNFIIQRPLPFEKKTLNNTQLLQLGIRRGISGAKLLMINRRCVMYDMTQSFARWKAQIFKEKDQIALQKDIKSKMIMEVSNINTLSKGLNALLKHYSRLTTCYFLTWKHISRLNFPFYHPKDVTKWLASQYFMRFLNASLNPYRNELKKFNIARAKAEAIVTKGGTSVRASYFLADDSSSGYGGPANSKASEPSRTFIKKHSSGYGSKGNALVFSDSLRIHFVDLYKRLDLAVGLLSRKKMGEVRGFFLHLKALNLVNQMVSSSKSKLKTVHKMKTLHDMKKILIQVAKKRMWSLKNMTTYSGAENAMKSFQRSSLLAKKKAKFPDVMRKIVRRFQLYFIQKKFFRWRLHNYFCNQLEPLRINLQAVVSNANSTTDTLQELIQAERKKAPEIFKYRCIKVLGTDLGNGKPQERGRVQNFNKKASEMEPQLPETLENKVVLLIKEVGVETMDEMSKNLMKVLIKRRMDPETVIKKEMCSVLHSGMVSILSMITNAETRKSQIFMPK